jgi:hypothetical protein
MTAPGPKIASHRRGLRERSEAGGGTGDWEFTRGTISHLESLVKVNGPIPGNQQTAEAR